MSDKPETIDEYIATFPAGIQEVLQTLRGTIHMAVPGLAERLSYGIPTFALDGKSLIYFGAWKHHIGVYPVSALDEPLESEVSEYREAKDTLRFPYDRPMPYDLIGEVVTVLWRRRLQEGAPPAT